MKTLTMSTFTDLLLQMCRVVGDHASRVLINSRSAFSNHAQSYRRSQIIQVYLFMLSGIMLGSGYAIPIFYLIGERDITICILSLSNA